MHFKSCIAALALSAALIPPAAHAAEARSAELSPDISKKIDDLFVRFKAEYHVPGLVYGIIREGQPPRITSHGVQDLDAKRPVTADTVFRIASMSKAFTALAILHLRDQGKLGLDDVAEKYVPEMRGWRYPTSDSPRIRIRDLLHHVSGMVTDDPWGDRQQVLTQDEFTQLIAAGVPFSRPPQTRHEYSNYGYALLGRIIANVSGMAYKDYIQQTILIPLGMTASGFVPEAIPANRRAIGYRWENERFSEEPTMRDGAFNAMGGLQVSGNDYAKWVSFLLSAWPPRDGAETGPIKRATVREMAQGLNFISVMQRGGTTGAESCRVAQAYAMGWRVTQDCELGLTMAHGGGYPGYGSFVVLLPEMGVGFFALSNRTYAGPSGPIWDAAVMLQRAGLITPRTERISADLSLNFTLSHKAYRAGNLIPLASNLAMNFLLDRSAENWAKHFAELKAQVGDCPTVETLTPTGQMSATFHWACDRGAIEGTILLAPTTPQTVQALRLRAVPKLP